jgi:acetyl-CoA C-acetyltransferase
MSRFKNKPGVYITGVSQSVVEKKSEQSLKELGSKVINEAIINSGIEKIDALYVGNMLSGTLNNQQQLGSLLANAAGLKKIEALTLEAACGSGGAALRIGYIAIMSGLCENVVVCGVEKMSHNNKEFITKSIATASDWDLEGGKGETFVTLNSQLMKMYMNRYNINSDCFAMFGVNAHQNAFLNQYSLFKKQFSLEDYKNAPFIAEPIKMLDASPICDGAAALVLSKYPNNEKKIPQVKIIASSCATESVSINGRIDPLNAVGIHESGKKAYSMAGIGPEDIDFFELHDAYSIISTLSLEAMGFAEKGNGWKLAAEGEIALNGKIPISTFGGLKARGHPIGASGVYQAVESYHQLTGTANANQIKKEIRAGLIQSIGGTASTAITHIMVT